jgi:hypothetical protein
MPSTNSTLTLTRTGNVVTHQTANGKETGEISNLTVAGLDVPYYALERRGGYVTLLPGSYSIKMETSPTHGQRKQFRVMNHGIFSSQNQRPAAILIHPGNYPGEVTGCIAPGKKKLHDGVGKSAAAMSEIIAQFGGFEAGKEATLIVIGTAAK